MTKKNRTVFIIVMVTLAVVFIWMYDSFMTNDYDWQRMTYHHEDKEPYGCKVFDHLLEASFPKGYSHSYLPLGELQRSFDVGKTCFLMVNPDDSFLDEDIDTLLTMAAKGATFMIAAGHFPDSLLKIMHLKTNFIFILRDSASLSFNARPSLPFKVEQKAIFTRFEKDTVGFLANVFTKPTPLAMADSEWITVRYPYGRGTFILTTTPLLHTNWGIMRADTRRFVLQQLGYVADRRIVRTEYYNSYYHNMLHYFHDGEAPSLFSVIVSNRATLWALIVILLLVALFFITNAVRRQQPIPIIKPPQNRIMYFVSSIAGLYLHRNSNTDILLKKRLYWADRLQRSTGINIADFQRNGEISRILAEKSHQSSEKVQALLDRLFSIDEKQTVSDEELVRLVREMDDIL